MNAATETAPTCRTQADWNTKIRAYYTNSQATVARLAECTDTVKLLDRAGTMLATARNPGFRFGLTREDITNDVLYVLEVAVMEARAKLLPFAARMRELKAAGEAMDTIWNILDDEGAGEHGLRYGHSRLLMAL